MAVSVVMVLAGCGATKKLATTSSTNLSIAATATSFTRNFNFLAPTNQSSLPPGNDLIYEPLIEYSPSTGFTAQPWLGASWVWSDDGKTLTWTLRSGVKWSDGQPFTSADVAYTIGLLKNPQLALGNPGAITSVDTPNPTTVVVHYSASGYAGFGRYYGLKILPRHIWASHDAATWTDPDPVGTGPFTLGNFGLQRITYDLRPDYWGGASKGVKNVTYNAAADPAAVLQDLLTGVVDYAESPLIGRPSKTFVAQDKSTNHFWLPSPGASESLLFNNAVAPTNDVNVRHALYDSLNAAQLVTLTPGVFGIPANVTGLNEPSYTQWIAPQYRGKTQTQDPAAAKAALTAGGWTVKSGNLTKDGKSYPLTLKVDPADAGAPWSVGIIGQIKDVLGINVALDENAQNSQAAVNGTYTLALGPDTPGQGAAGGLLFDVAAPVPVGKPASSGNYARGNSPEAVALATQLGTTSDVSAQQALAYKIEQIMVEQRFTAPIAAYSWSVAYTTKKWTGWPDPSNPKTVPPNGRADLIKTILNLEPANKA